MWQEPKNKSGKLYLQSEAESMKLCWGLISRVRNKFSHIPGSLLKGTLHKTPGCYHLFGIVKELAKFI